MDLYKTRKPRAILSAYRAPAEPYLRERARRSSRRALRLPAHAARPRPRPASPPPPEPGLPPARPGEGSRRHGGAGPRRGRGSRGSGARWRRKCCAPEEQPRPEASCGRPPPAASCPDSGEQHRPFRGGRGGAAAGRGCSGRASAARPQLSGRRGRGGQEPGGSESPAPGRQGHGAASRGRARAAGEGTRARASRGAVKEA